MALMLSRISADDCSNVSFTSGTSDFCQVGTTSISGVLTASSRNIRSDSWVGGADEGGDFCSQALTAYICSLYFPDCSVGNVETPVCDTACQLVVQHCTACSDTDDSTICPVNCDAPYLDINGVNRTFGSSVCTCHNCDFTTEGSFDFIQLMKDNPLWTGVISAGAFLFLVLLFAIIYCICRCCCCKSKSSEGPAHANLKSVRDMIEENYDIELAPGFTGAEKQLSSSSEEEVAEGGAKPSKKSTSSSSSSSVRRKASESLSAPSLSHSHSVEMLPTGIPVELSAASGSSSQSVTSSHEVESEVSSPPSSEKESSEQESESAPQSDSSISSSPSSSSAGPPPDTKDAMGDLDNIFGDLIPKGK